MSRLIRICLLIKYLVSWFILISLLHNAMRKFGTFFMGHPVLLKNKSHYDLRKFSFTNRIVNIWNSLPNAVVDVNSVEVFKSWLDNFWKFQDVKIDYIVYLTGTRDRSELLKLVLKFSERYGHRGSDGACVCQQFRNHNAFYSFIHSFHSLNFNHVTWNIEQNNWNDKMWKLKMTTLIYVKMHFANWHSFDQKAITQISLWNVLIFCRPI